MKNKKIAQNLYKMGENSYRILIKRKNSKNQLVDIDMIIEANSDENAILYLNTIYKENYINLITKKTKIKKAKSVDKHIYEYGKNYYRIHIRKNKVFPDGFSEYYEADLKEVKEVRDRLLAERKIKNSPILKLRNLTLNQFFYEEFVPKYCPDLSPLTTSGYKSDYELFIGPKFGNYRLRDLENMTADLNLFIIGLKKVKKQKLTKAQLANKEDIYLSGKYRNSIYNHLNSIFNVAINFKGMATNPMSSIKPPKYKSKKTKIYKTKQVFNILDLLMKESIRERFIVALFICSGLRRGELVGLHIDDFDFEKNCIYVRRNAIYDPVKKMVVEKDTKTDNGERTITLPQFVMDYARLWFIEREKQIDIFTERELRLRKAIYIAPDNIFLSRFGKIIHPDTPGEVWAAFRDKNALEHVTPHGLRTTFSTSQYHDNPHLTQREIAILMGHSKSNDYSMTKHYTQEDEDKLPNSTFLFDKYAEDRGIVKKEDTIILEKEIRTKEVIINKQETINKTSEIDYNINKGTTINVSFDQLVTIITGNVYCNTENMVDIVKEYYQTDENINYGDMPKLLYKIKRDLLFNDNTFDDIENYIQNSDDDWKLLYEGKNKFGNNFKIGIIKNRRTKYNNYYNEVDKEFTNQLEM